MVKNMADFCIVFHFYATSLSSLSLLQAKQKREKNKAGLLQRVLFCLTCHMNDASPTEELRNYFCDYSANDRKPKLENMVVGGELQH